MARTFKARFVGGNAPNISTENGGTEGAARLGSSESTA
jgi:hypothetical protein